MSKIYLVRWPTASVSLVTAQDETQLFETVIANSSENLQCTFEEYMGENLFLTFTPQPSPTTHKSPLIATCEAPETQEEALQDFRALYHSRLFADVELKVDSQYIPCHRAVLAQRCKYFRAMFDSNMKEASQKVIELSGFSFPVVEAVIKFLYTGVLDVPCDSVLNEKQKNGELNPEALRTFTVDTKFPFLIEVLKASDFYGMTSLHKLCLSELQNIMSSDKSNTHLAQQLFSVGTKFENECLRDHACIAIGKELSRCMIFNEDASEQFSLLSDDLKQHLRHIWEDKLHQNPIYFGKDRELMDCLTISTPAPDEIVQRVKELISQGAEPLNIGALHVLCQHWNVASTNQNELFKELSEIFIKAGCDINKINYSDHAPLHIAAKQGRLAQVQVLLALGADPHLRCRSHGYTPLEEVVHSFDEQTAILVNTPNVSLSPGRVIALKRSAYVTCRQTCEVLAHAMRTTPPRKSSEQSDALEDPELNSYFINRLFTHKGLDVSARVQFDTANFGVHRKDFDETLLEFMLPKFAAEWDIIQRKAVEETPVETEEAKKRLKSALIKDYRNARSLRGSGDKMASLHRLKNQGRFADFPQDSWIHDYSIFELVHWDTVYVE